MKVPKTDEFISGSAKRQLIPVEENTEDQDWQPEPVQDSDSDPGSDNASSDGEASQTISVDSEPDGEDEDTTQTDEESIAPETPPPTPPPQPKSSKRQKHAPKPATPAKKVKKVAAPQSLPPPTPRKSTKKTAPVKTSKPSTPSTSRMPPPAPPPAPPAPKTPKTSGAKKDKKKEEVKLSFGVEEKIEDGEDMSIEGQFHSLHKSYGLGGNYTATLTNVTRRDETKKGSDNKGLLIGKSLCMRLKRGGTNGNEDFAYNVPCERIEPLYKVMQIWLGREETEETVEGE